MRVWLRCGQAAAERSRELAEERTRARSDLLSRTTRRQGQLRELRKTLENGTQELREEQRKAAEVDTHHNLVDWSALCCVITHPLQGASLTFTI